MSDNIASHSEVLAGGTVRVSFGTPAPEVQQAAHVESLKVVDGVTRWTAGGQAEQFGGVVRHTVSFDGVPGGSVLSTLARAGTHQTVELEPGVPGSRTPVEAAIRAGVLVRAADGTLRDARTADGKQQTMQTLEAERQQAAQQQDVQQVQQQATDLEGVFNAMEDNAWRAEMASIPEHAFAPAMASVVKAMTFGEGFDQAAARLARDTGMASAQAAEVVDNAVWYHQQIIDRAVAKMGLGEDQRSAFYAGLLNDPGRLQNAIHHLAHCRDVGPFQQLAREYIETTGRRSRVELDRNEATNAGRPVRDEQAAGVPGLTEENLRAAGFQTSTSRDGVLMVRAGQGGNWVPAANLLKG